jgi:hypothetical protein
MTGRVDTRPAEELSLAELLDRQAARAAAEERRRLELEAELAILLAFDWRRSAAGHDYGGGQRAAELQRRQREVIRLGGTTEPGLAGMAGAGADLEAAWARVAAPRIRRLERDAAGARPAGTSGARRARRRDGALQAWARVRVELERAIGAAR